MITQQDLNDAIQLLEIREDFAKLQSCSSYQQACQVLEQIKNRAKKQRRKLALRYHSDLGGSTTGNVFASAQTNDAVVDYTTNSGGYDGLVVKLNLTTGKMVK